MWQQIIVAVIVVAAVLHFCTKYLPAAWRKQCVALLARRGVDEQRAAKWFNVKGGGGCGSGCGGCGSSSSADAKGGACESTSATSSSASTNPNTPTSDSSPRQRVITLHVQP